MVLSPDFPDIRRDFNRLKQKEGSPANYTFK